MLAYYTVDFKHINLGVLLTMRKVPAENASQAKESAYALLRGASLVDPGFVVVSAKAD